MEYLPLIFIMAAITFSCRYLFFAKSLKLTIGPRLKNALTYTAPAVLTAMWVPIVFDYQSVGKESILHSPYFYAGMFAIYLSLKVEKTLLVVFGSIALFFVLNNI